MSSSKRSGEIVERLYRWVGRVRGGGAHRIANGPPPTASSSISTRLLHSVGLFNSSAGPSAAAAAEITPFKKSARRPLAPRRWSEGSANTLAALNFCIQNFPPHLLKNAKKESPIQTTSHYHSISRGCDAKC